MRPIGKQRPRSWAAAWLRVGGLLFLGALTVFALPAAPSEAEETSDLPQRQANIRAILVETSKRMDRLAERLEAAQPDDAKRLREAAEKIRNPQVNDLFGNISTLLKSLDLLDAVVQQDRAIVELDSIIQFLEGSRTADAQLDKAIEALKDARLEAGKLARKQESLLQKTQEFLEKSGNLKALQQLETELSELQEKQSGLNEGKDPESLDPSAREMDEEALRSALALSKELLDEQQRISQKTEGLPTESLPIKEAKDLATRLAELGTKAEDLVARIGEADKGAEGKTKEPSQGSEAEKKAVETKRTEALEAAKGLSKGLEDLKGEMSAGAAKEMVDEAAAEAKSAEEKLAGKSDALDDAKRAREAIEKARAELAKDLQGIEEKNASETAGIVQEQGMLEKKTEDGSARMEDDASKSSSRAAQSTLSEASKSLSEAAKSMRQAADSLSGGRREEARKADAKALEDLSKAVDSLASGQKALGSRDEREKAKDLQKKLAQKAEEARKKLEELQKKIGAKDKERAAGLEEGNRALSEASRSMGQAAESRESGLAKKRGEEALAQLQRASDAIRKAEKEELARLEKESLKKEKGEQEELARLTRELAKKMPEPASAENMEQASGSMEQASQDLAREDASSAEKKQEEALAKLKQAQDELRQKEEELARLNREREMLSMVSELTAIREGQVDINSATAKIDSARASDESRLQRRRVQDAVTSLVDREEGLLGRVDNLTKRLKEETARVYLFILNNVGADMRQIRDSLKELETGSYTQFLQKTVIEDIDRLLAALKDELRQQKNEGGGGGRQSEARPPLVSLTAELRLLKDMQLDVNRKTRDLDDLRKASDSGVPEAWGKALDRLMQKQGSISRMTKEILDDFQKLGGPGEETEGEAVPRPKEE